MATQSIPGPNSNPDNQSFQILCLKKKYILGHIYACRMRQKSWHLWQISKWNVKGGHRILGRSGIQCAAMVTQLLSVNTVVWTGTEPGVLGRRGCIPPPHFRHHCLDGKHYTWKSLYGGSGKCTQKNIANFSLKNTISMISNSEVPLLST